MLYTETNVQGTKYDFYTKFVYTYLVIMKTDLKSNVKCFKKY